MFAIKPEKLSVFCADAWLTLAERPSLSSSERRQMIERAVAAGELALGEGGLKENEGHFWGVLETRPYMRARGELGEVLWDAGEKEAAIQNYREMLILNPGDNQGIRYILAAKLLEMGKMDMLKSLMEQYADEYSPEIQYTRALIAYFEEAENAEDIARLALETNRHVPGMLSGRMPTVHVGDYVTLGGKDQASSYVDANGTAWRQIPGAVEWLDEITSSVGVSWRHYGYTHSAKPHEHSTCRERCSLWVCSVLINTNGFGHTQNEHSSIENRICTHIDDGPEP